MKNTIAITKRQIEIIADFTDSNAHTQARIYLSILLGAKDLEKCYRAIYDLHTFFGNIPYGLSEVRNELDKRLFKYVDENCSLDEANKIKQSF